MKISATQAKTAELMAKTLEQQGKILDEQTKIMSEQFKFQRRVAAQAEREKVFDYLLDSRTSVVMLISKVEEPGECYPPRLAEEKRLQDKLVAATLPCQKALIASIHLSPEEKEYFGRYISDVSRLLPSTNLPADLGKLKQLDVTYKDFVTMTLKVGQTLES